jgi:ribonuclease HI
MLYTLEYSKYNCVIIFETLEDKNKFERDFLCFSKSCIKENVYDIYTDGSAIQNKSAGYGVLFDKRMGLENIQGETDIKTNQYAELYAIYKAIETINEYNNDKNNIYIIHTDSMYCINSLTIWYKNWRRNGYKNKNGDDIKYKELIEEILHFDVFDQICFEYVKGHSNNEKNDIVDNMSKKAIK